MTVHDEDILNQEELNKRQIDENKYSILQNRIMIVGSCVLAIAMIVGSNIVLKHDIEDCQETLYQHITGNEVHRDMFVSTDDKSLNSYTDEN